MGFLSISLPFSGEKRPSCRPGEQFRCCAYFVIPVDVFEEENLAVLFDDRGAVEDQHGNLVRQIHLLLLLGFKLRHGQRMRFERQRLRRDSYIFRVRSIPDDPEIRGTAPDLLTCVMIPFHSAPESRHIRFAAPTTVQTQQNARLSSCWYAWLSMSLTARLPLDNGVGQLESCSNPRMIKRTCLSCSCVAEKKTRPASSAPVLFACVSGECQE